MTHSVILPVMDELHEVKGILALLRNQMSRSTELVVIDNGSKDNYEEFIRRFLKPSKIVYIRNEENVGMVKTMQQGYEQSSGDILTYIHNDVYIYEDKWDAKIEEIFLKDPKIGMVGAFGAAGVGADGGRIQVVNPGCPPGYSNMLEAEIHGERIYDPYVYCSIFDGFLMSVRRSLLDKTGGFDQRYQWHHFYDRDLSLESLRHGYKNVVMNLSCHHVCGRTANQARYQEFIKDTYGQGKFDNTQQYSGDKATHDDNMRRFGEKWGEVLPIYVDKHTGEFWGHPYKGNSIVGYKI